MEKLLEEYSPRWIDIEYLSIDYDKEQGWSWHLKTSHLQGKLNGGYFLTEDEALMDLRRMIVILEYAG